MPTRTSSLSIPREDLKAAVMEVPLAENFIATMLFPNFPVNIRTGNFGKIPKEALRSLPSVTRSRGSGYNRGSWELEDDSFTTKPYGWEEVDDDEERANYEDYFQYQTVLADRARGIVLRNQEVRVKDLIHNTGTFALSGNTGLSIVEEWDDETNADPFEDIAYGQNKVRSEWGVTCDTLQISWKTAWDLSRCNKVLDRLKYTSSPPNRLSDEELARAFKLKRVIVGDAQYNSADDGLTPVLADIWSPEYAFLCKTAEGMDLAQPCIGRTFAWSKRGGQLAVDEYREENVEGGIIRVKQHTHEKIVQTVGFLFGNVYTA